MSILALQERSVSYVKGNQKIKPGQPVRFSDAATIGDYGDQGDLRIELINDIGNDESFSYEYHHKDDGLKTKVYKLQNSYNALLVPGNTIGSNHYLEDAKSCTIFYPAGWSKDASYEEYEGPILKCHHETTIKHPVHGDVTIPAGNCVFLSYQRVFDVEQMKERRQLD